MNKKDIREYRIWKDMKSRCYSPSSQKGNYKKRNLQVCERWKNSFDKFIEDMGYAPTNIHSIERIDNTKGYYPENCKWIPMNEQPKNRDTFNKIFIYSNRAETLKEWSRILGIKYTTLYQRIYRQGLSFEDAIVFSKDYVYKDIKGTLKEIVGKYSKVSYQLVVDRMHKGWSLEKSLNTNKI